MSYNQFETVEDLIETLEQDGRDTREVIASMLTENTGAALLDSGGYPKYDDNGNYIGSSSGYGRNHEVNRGRDFESERYAVMSVDRDWDGKPEILYTVNLYHWLVERLDYAPDLDALFYWFADETDPEQDKIWSELIEDFFKWLYEHFDVEPRGMYGDGEPLTVNTYNHESALSQVIQFTMFETEQWGEVYFLRIHGGADVRGGYTAPRAFVNNGNYSELALFYDADGHLHCSECGADWHTDDAGYHWYSGNRGPDIGGQRGAKAQTLEGFDRRMTQALARAVLANVQPGDLDHQMYISDEDSIITCPVCHNGVLEA